jgi:CubicO group peptidase (beta-lactamase class C family)
MLLKDVFRLSILILFLVGSLVLGLEAQAVPRINGVDARIEALKDEGHFPGIALAVMRNGKPVHIGAYGMADVSHDIPVTTQTVFELASLTKQMTALAIMTLVKEDRLRLDAQLSDYVEDAPKAWGKITIDQLLSHRAGLAHRFEQTVDGILLLDYTREDMMASAKKTPMIAEPGSDWNYSDQGYFLLGIVIEAVTKQSYAEYMQSTFFKPLGMEQTQLLDQSQIVPFLSQGYAWKDGKLQRNRRVWQFALTSHFGVMSSLHDMMRWEAELVDPKVINRDALEATWDIQRVFDTGKSCDNWGYARGWTVHIVDGRRILTHGGYAGTAYIRAVDDDLSVIVLTNREDAPDELFPLSVGWAAAHAAAPTIHANGYRCWE